MDKRFSKASTTKQKYSCYSEIC